MDVVRKTSPQAPLAEERKPGESAHLVRSKLTMELRRRIEGRQGFRCGEAVQEGADPSLGIQTPHWQLVSATAQPQLQNFPEGHHGARSSPADDANCLFHLLLSVLHPSSPQVNQWLLP